MSTERIFDLIAKEISGTLSEEETRELQSLKAEKPELYSTVIRDWDKAGSFNLAHTPDTEASWARFQEAIQDAPAAPVFSFSPFYKVAAAVIIAVGLGLVFFNPWSAQEYITKAGEKLEVTLPDQSVITLNEMSSLTLARSFNEKERFVEFTGEAYFDIAENPDKPFIIQSGISEVRVLGTSFNVDAREDKEFVEVDVTSGRVSLSEIGNSSNQVLLTKGMSGQLSTSSRLLAATEYSNENFQAWKTKQLEFEDILMTEVADDMEEYFGKEIGFENDAITSCKFTSSFSEPTIEEVLQILALTLDLRFSETEQGYILQGNGCSETAE